MKTIIDKYKDKNGYISDLVSLYEELIKNGILETEIIDILNNITEENKIIIERLKNDTAKIKKILSNKKEIKVVEYKKEIDYTPTIQIPEQKKQIEDVDISFYINYIKENLANNNYVEILPINTDFESIKIIDTILSYYLKEINTIKYFLTIEQNDKEIANMIEDLEIYVNIFQTIKKYKEELYYIDENNKEEYKNELLFYMDGSVPYVYSDIVDSPGSFESIKTLLKSIENGTFKSLKSFTSNDKLKGILEVRDLYNGTRVIFEPLGGRKYCIIYAIIDKKETTQLYKQRLYLRYKKYLKDKDNIKPSNEIKEIKELLLKGD